MTALAKQDDTGSAKPETRGRKRLLNRDDILRSAVDLGLEDLRMSDLANELGVGTATLYQYFDGRKALIRAAAVYAMGDISWPQDKGQSWQDLASDYMHMLAELLSQSPDFLTGPSHSDYGYETHFRLFEQFAESMERRGFDATQATDIFHCVSMTSFGAAVETLRAREFQVRGDTAPKAIQRQFAATEDGAYPRTGAALDAFALGAMQKADRVLTFALNGFAPATNGEEL
jgi:AcrR family transcriptional regulator